MGVRVETAADLFKPALIEADNGLGVVEVGKVREPHLDMRHLHGHGRSRYCDTKRKR